MIKSSQLADNQGFTLVEVLIALLVLGIIFVPVSNAFLQSVHLNQQLKQRVEAVRDAQTAMEVTLSVMNTLDQSESTKSEEGSEENSDKSEKANHVEKDQQIDEQIINLFADFDTSDLIKADTTVEVAPLHEDSPFFIITATSSYTTKGATNNFTLTSVHLPGEAPWLTPEEYRVVTP